MQYIPVLNMRCGAATVALLTSKIELTGGSEIVVAIPVMIVCTSVSTPRPLVHLSSISLHDHSRGCKGYLPRGNINASV